MCNKKIKQHSRPIQQGYLQKKSEGKSYFIQRYYRIINGNLYWYADEKSQIINNQLSVKEIGDINYLNDKSTFTMIIKNGKKSIFDLLLFFPLIFKVFKVFRGLIKKI